MKRQNGLRLYAAPMLVWLYLCGCGVTNAGYEGGLEETAWRLEAIESVDGEIIFRPPSAEIYRFEFITPDSVRAQDDCNTCLGSYALGSEGAISFNVGCTEAGCGIAYGGLLSSATTYVLEGGTLRISYNLRGEEGVLVHRAESQ